LSLSNIAADPHPATSTSLLDAAAAILAQGEQLLDLISDEDYRRAVPVAFDASIGGHYRHCLDHFTILLDGLEAGEIHYDHRERNPRTEVERGFASHLTRELKRRLGVLAPSALDRTVSVLCAVQRGGDSPSVRSSAGRELNYVVAHAIHHYALIAMIAGIHGVRLPREFGVAPSTLNHHDRQAVSAGA